MQRDQLADERSFRKEFGQSSAPELILFGRRDSELKHWRFFVTDAHKSIEVAKQSEKEFKPQLDSLRPRHRSAAQTPPLRQPPPQGSRTPAVHPSPRRAMESEDTKRHHAFLPGRKAAYMVPLISVTASPSLARRKPGARARHREHRRHAQEDTHLKRRQSRPSGDSRLQEGGVITCKEAAARKGNPPIRKVALAEDEMAAALDAVKETAEAGEQLPPAGAQVVDKIAPGMRGQNTWLALVVDSVEAGQRGGETGREEEMRCNGKKTQARARPSQAYGCKLCNLKVKKIVGVSHWVIRILSSSGHVLGHVVIFRSFVLTLMESKGYLSYCHHHSYIRPP
ncbi:hypothetical protein V8E53_008661 [Lactarius tabidus]